MLKATLTCLSLAFSISAHAALINIDWKTAGDNKAVLHEETGLEWLDMTQTIGSYNMTASRLQEGGDLFGWRFATEQEVYTMLSAIAGVTLSPSSPHFVGSINSNPAYSDAYEKYVSLFGTVSSAGGSTTEAVKGGYLTASGTFRWATGFYNIVNSVTYVGIRANESSNYTVNTNLYNLGSFLVSDGGLTLSGSSNVNDENPIGGESTQDVSIAPLGAMGALLLGLAGWRRNKRS